MGPKQKLKAKPQRATRKEIPVKNRHVKKNKTTKTNKRCKTSTTLDFEVRHGKLLPPDYFVPLYPINILMALILSLLVLCALDPEDCALIPGYRENTVRQGWIAACLFAFMLLLNLIMTIQVLKLCEKNQLTTNATKKWLCQTLISGVLSWKVLREADDVLRETDLTDSISEDNFLLGPFFINCNKKQLTGFIKCQN